MQEELVGAVKVKDGLFLGDEYSAQVSILFNIFEF